MQNYVAFHMDEEDYGLDLKYVKEVILAVAIRKIPHSLAFVKGVINIRGMITPVIDLKRLFSNQNTKYGAKSHLVIAQKDQSLVALMVDEVYDVLSLRAEDLQTPQSTIPISHFLEFVGQAEGKLILLLNLAKILDTTKLCSLDRPLDVNEG